MKITTPISYSQSPMRYVNQNNNYPRQTTKTNIKIPINQISQYRNQPGLIDIDLTLQFQPSETSSPPPKNRYLQQRKVKTSNTPIKPSLANKSDLVKCNICQQLINKLAYNQHYFNHKLITQSKTLQSKTYHVNAISKYNNAILETQRKLKDNSKKLFHEIIQQYPLRTTDVQLDELINSIKLQNIVKRNNKLLDRQSNMIQNKINIRQQYQYEQQPTKRKQNNYQKSKQTNFNCEYQYPIKYSNYNLVNFQHPLLTEVATTEQIVEYRYLSSKSTSKKRKLSLSKDIQKQIFFSRQKQPQLSYKFQRKNNRKNTSYSLTKSKVPLNILAQNK